MKITKLEAFPLSIKYKRKEVSALIAREGVSDVIVKQEVVPLLTQREINNRVVISKGSPLNLIRIDSSRVSLQASLFDKGYADAEVDTAVDTLTSVIEPVMIVVMGGIVGGMVVSMYLPMFKLISVVAGGH